MAPSLNTVTIGDKPVYDPPVGVMGLNRFVMRTGASRYGKGVFAMRRQDYDDLASSTASAGGKTTLAMQGDPGPGLALAVILAGAEPISIAVGSDPSNDLMKVSVYDLRSTFFSTINKSYNVQKDGFPLDGSNNPICFTSTLNSGNPWDWSGLLIDAEIITQDGIPNSIPDWNPYNLIWDKVPSARALDDAAAQMFYIVGFDHQAASAIDGVSLFPPYQSARGIENEDTGFSTNFDLVDQVNQVGCLTSGALPGSPAAVERNYSRLPFNLDVTFPSVGYYDPFSSHRNYSKRISTGFGISGYNMEVSVGNQIAVWNGTSWLNQSTLDAVAADLAARASIFISQNFGEAEYAGIWPFKPDGRIRQVEWVSYPDWYPESQQGARTIIKTDNAKDWLPTDSLGDPINLNCNQEVIEIGSSYSAIGCNGTKYIWNKSLVGLFVLAATATHPGMYTAHPVIPPSVEPDPTGSSQLADSNIGTAGTDTVYLKNAREIATAGHALAPGTFPDMIFGFFSGIWTDGKPVYTISVCQ